MSLNRTIILAVMGCVLGAGVPSFAQNGMGAETASGQQGVLINPAKIYNDKHPYKWVGKWVTLKNVQVQDTNDSGNFWVGSDDDHRLLIVKPEKDANLQAIRVHKGDVVTVSGLIRPASKYMAHTTSAEKGSMSDARDSSGVFLMANSIRVASSTRH